MSECRECGAAVLDRARHRRWHDRTPPALPARPLRFLGDPDPSPPEPEPEPEP